MGANYYRYDGGNGISDKRTGQLFLGHVLEVPMSYVLILSFMLQK